MRIDDAARLHTQALAQMRDAVNDATFRPVEAGGIGSIGELEGGSPAGGPRAPETTSFEATLKSALGDAKDMAVTANEKSQALAAGKSDDVHGTMIAVKEAEISLKLVGAVRNKLLDAFHELWRTSV